MTAELFVWWMLALVAIASAVMVVSAKNPVHSVLFLILCFFNTAGMFVLAGAEFLAMILVVVYVGAVAVLFLFVVMMLDINFVRLREGFLNYLPVGALVGLVLLAELVLVGATWALKEPGPGVAVAEGIDNTRALGRLLYTEHFVVFQIAGLILLVAIVGAIALTLRQRVGVKRQDVARQVHRRPEETVTLVRVETGKGV
ncbi:MAG: NADH-quinone oxidoreductase subunit J [Geminicoccaceae bacterium]|nr:NADH-quinone oxidoreductase subunit J [Geminicoccaceae bacterium]MCS7268439.1 NADH-quinone oxidoreductase subunit J [Geminicoccaceae bacterium]MCX7630242.1 NADH-quinone oxidoreductase subunit J [Geminicoccaceae bacterium]MDW8124909.1 NADH-quinone oxidoreductase subunit J [Geminicoccaceae bacterium]MDW8340957.1 NADH-quinone oxidoreductase subunit J [Geminicoccaceae bacterium]